MVLWTNSGAVALTTLSLSCRNTRKLVPWRSTCLKAVTNREVSLTFLFPSPRFHLLPPHKQRQKLRLEFSSPRKDALGFLSRVVSVNVRGSGARRGQRSSVTISFLVFLLSHLSTFTLSWIRLAILDCFFISSTQSTAIWTLKRVSRWSTVTSRSTIQL